MPHSLLAILLDGSGSMDAQRTVNAFNAFMELQMLREDEVVVAYSYFDDYLRPLTFKPLGEMPLLQVGVHYRADGTTQLYHSLSLFLNEVARWLLAQPEAERPKDITVVVQSDGGDNHAAAEPWPLRDAARDAVEFLKGKGWKFLFLADITHGHEAKFEASRLGFTSRIDYHKFQAQDAYTQASAEIIEAIIAGQPLPVAEEV